MYALIRNLLFLLPPEIAHQFTMRLSGIVLRMPILSGLIRYKQGLNPSNPFTYKHLTFKNRIGLAAGFDKNAHYTEIIEQFGFGHLETGTVTPLPQDGNPKPRLFRLQKDKALINRMGFNNLGVDEMVMRLKRHHGSIIIGGNIGKNKITPNEKAVDDYKICFEKLYEVVDYFTVNVSSPNTPGLRELQDKNALKEILMALIEIRDRRIAEGQIYRPILLKIAPDLSEFQLDDIVELKRELAFDGIISGNTTVSRENLRTPKEDIEKIGMGGLSGEPLKALSLSRIKYLREKLPEAWLIGVGGIMTAEDGKAMLEAGADLIQIYTGFIYSGPELVEQLSRY